MPDAPPKLRKGVPRDEVLFHGAFTDAKAGNRTLAIAGFIQTIRLNPKNADALYNLGVTLFATAEFDKALDVFNTAIAVNAKLAAAYFGKGCTLGELGRSTDAIAAYDDLLARFGKATKLPLRALVANALINKGVILIKRGDTDDAITLYDNLLARFSKATELPLREVVGKALVNKGFSLTVNGHHGAALTVHDDLLARFDTAPELPLRALVATALLNKGFTLNDAGRSDRVIAVYDDLVSRFDTAPELPLRELVAKALFNKRVTLDDAGRSDDAIAVSNILLARFGSAPELALRKLVAKALLDTTHMLTEANDYEAAIKVCDELLARFDTAPELPLRELVAEALLKKGVWLGFEGHYEASIATLREAAKFEWQQEKVEAFIQTLLELGKQINDSTEEHRINQEKDELISETTGYTDPKKGDNPPPEEARGLTAPGDLSTATVDKATAYEIVAADTDFSSGDEVRKALREWKAAQKENTARETTDHAKAKPRPQWDMRHGTEDAELSPPEFIAKHYAAEMAAGTLHRGVIAQEDDALAVKLPNWLRTHKMPKGIDIPTLPEWNTRQLAKLESGPARKVLRLYEVARKRKGKSASLTAT